MTTSSRTSSLGGGNWESNRLCLWKRIPDWLQYRQQIFLCLTLCYPGYWILVISKKSWKHTDLQCFSFAGQKWKFLKMFFFNIIPLYLGQILTDWDLVFCKHPHLSRKGFCNKKSGVIGSAGEVIFGDAALRGAKKGVPHKKNFKNFGQNFYFRAFLSQVTKGWDTTGKFN